MSHRVFNSVTIEKSRWDGNWVVEPGHVGWVRDTKREALRAAVEDIPGPDMRLGSDPTFVIVEDGEVTGRYEYRDITRMLSEDRGDGWGEVSYRGLDPDFDFL